MEEEITINLAILPAIITGIAAFIGAVLAQVISHYLTLKRETVKYNREIYQYLFSPIIFDIYAYLDIATYFRHDLKQGVSERTYREKIIYHITNNLKYASPELISAFHNVKHNEFTQDHSGFSSDIDDLKLFLTVLNDLNALNLKFKLFNKENKDKIVYYQIMYLLWIALSINLHVPQEVATILSDVKSYFDNKSFTSKNYEGIKRMMSRNATYEEIIEYVLKLFVTKDEEKKNLKDIFFRNF